MGVFLLFPAVSFSETLREIDSMKTLLVKEDDLSKRGDLMYQLGQAYFAYHKDSAVLYLEAAYQVGSHQNDILFQSKVASVLGLAYQYEDEVKSTAYIFKALELAELSGDSSQIAYAYNTTGTHYRITGDLDKSIEFFRKAIAIRHAQQDSMSVAVCYNNMGISYMMKAEYDTGLYYWQRSLEIKLAIGEEMSAAYTMANIAIYYKDIGRLYEALEYSTQALEIELKNGDYQGASHSYTLLGDLYTKTENYPKAISSYKQSLDYADSIQSEYEKIEPLYGLAMAYKSTGNFREAFEALDYYSILFKRYNDENTQRISKEMQTRFETEKKEKENLLLKTENETKDLKIKEESARTELQRSNNRYLLAGLSLAVLLLVVIVFALSRVRKAKIQIEEQKHIVEEKNKEITDSINYAKRIQAAILPPDKRIKKVLPESFVLYKPKDIVAGDFYWLQQSGDTLFFAAADCTGHGVPGALVSVVCNNALNRAVREYGITDPGKILDKTCEIVIEEFEKSDDVVKDGMDISLCSLVCRNDSEGGLPSFILEWAGANNPLWILNQGAAAITEIKADKQPIGKFADRKPFKTHRFQLTKGDQIYLFTDGFQDQFGGDKGKKFKASHMKEHILAVKDQPMLQQKEYLDKILEAWKGQLEQVDDVCVLGVRL